MPTSRHGTGLTALLTDTLLFNRAPVQGESSSQWAGGTSQSKGSIPEILDVSVSQKKSIAPVQLISEQFITPKQLAEQLHVKASTIWEWTRRRQRKPVPHYPISRKVVYYKWSEVPQWIESRKARAA